MHASIALFIYYKSAKSTIDADMHTYTHACMHANTRSEKDESIIIDDTKRTLTNGV